MSDITTHVDLSIYLAAEDIYLELEMFLSYLRKHVEGGGEREIEGNSFTI